MNDDTLNYANRIRSEMGVVEKMLNRIEKKEAVVDITFNNGGYGCCSYLTAPNIIFGAKPKIKAIVSANHSRQRRLPKSERL